MNKEEALQTMIKAAKLFQENLCGKKILVVFGDENRPDFVEIKANGENFVHLTGVATSVSAGDFYERLLGRRLSENDFNFKQDGTSQLKLSVIESLLSIKYSAQIFGDYNYGRPRLYTKKLMGNIAASIGFVPAGKKYFVPNTILKGDIRDDITRGKHKVLAILSKPSNAKEYEQIVKVGKKVSVDDVLHKISSKVQIADSTLNNDRNKAMQSAAQVPDDVIRSDNVSAVAEETATAKKSNISQPEQKADNEPLFSMAILKSDEFAPRSSRDTSDISIENNTKKKNNLDL